MPSVRDNLAVCLIDGALERGLGDRAALREGERAWTYAQLAEQVARVSASLRDLGLARGDRVGVLMRDSLEAASAILGAIHAGCVAVPLSELARPLDLREYLADAGAAAMIVHAELEPALDEIRVGLPRLREVLCVGDTDRPGVRSLAEMVAANAPAPAAAAVSPSDPAIIAYSIADRERGVRGVPHAHATPLEAASCFARGVIGLDETDRVLSLVRMSTTYGLGCGLLFPLAVGAEALFLPEQPHSGAIFAAVEAFEPTVLFATPSVYGQLARDVADAGREGALAGVRACVSGAEGMPPKLIPRIRKQLGADVIAGYGLTEAFQFVLVGAAGAGRLGGCGRPVQGFEARILDADGKPVGPHVIGTLQIRGPTLLASYWEGDDDALEDGWFTTRDRFMMDEHGNYYHCGREDDAFKVGGKWVAPSEVERALLAHEAVWECAVIGAEDEDGLHKPLAFVVPNVGHEPSEHLERKLRAYVKDVLAPYKYPRWIEFVTELPRGPHGKLLRYKLRAPDDLGVETAGERDAQ